MVNVMTDFYLFIWQYLYASLVELPGALKVVPLVLGLLWCVLHVPPVAWLLVGLQFWLD